MGFFRFIFSRYFLLNFFIAIAVLVLLFWVSLKMLGSYTRHGETIAVPSLHGKTVEGAAEILHKIGLEYMINDSVFNEKAKKGAIIEQDPKPNVQVKYNRTIYLTVNAVLPPKVKMPNLVDLSLRQAKAILETYGLKAGSLSYVPDIAFNAVITQNIKGKNIEPGTLVDKGTVVDLILGEGESNELVYVPNLLDMTLEEAIAALSAASLNIGSIIKDKAVADSLQAKVYKQIPEYSPQTRVNAGKAVDLFITDTP